VKKVLLFLSLIGCGQAADLSPSDISQPDKAAATEAVAATHAFTPVQLHIAYFDVNGDGKVNYGEFDQRAKVLGISALDRVTIGHAVIDLFGTGGFLGIGREVIIANMPPGASLTGIWDAQGQADWVAFDNFVQTWDKDGDGQLSQTELNAFADTLSLADSIRTKAGFYPLLSIAADGNGTDGSPAISVEGFHAFYDGSLFYKLTGTPVP
jgi:hypothetical protein